MIMMKNKKVAAITGAYSGLGAALSELLAKKGYALVLGGRDKEKLQQFTEKMKKITEVEAVQMDVRKKDDCSKFIQEGVKRFQRLDILINNAGILYTLTPLEEITEEELLDTYRVNVFGPIYCAQAAVKIMKKQSSGHIVNIGSTSALDYKPSHTAYGSSKSALVGFSGSLKTELQGTGIKVTCFNPGGMKTELFRRQPERKTLEFMDPQLVAQKIVEHLESNSEEWLITLRRPK